VTDSTQDPKTETFETRLAELERLVEQLESGDLELADSLDKFKRGVELSKECRAMLDEAQQTVDELVADDATQSESGEKSD
jgi:exodeoxyribonuclease VII small subunit